MLAYVWHTDFANDLDMVHNKCQTCKRYTKTPAHPVVSLPMAKHFNEKVAMDLKIKKGKQYILHMVDMFTRLSVSVFVRSKQPKEIINKVMKHWVAVWGIMDGVLFDNGGEFSNEEMQEVASILGVQIHTTPAESPWSNGLCERNHQVTDRMLEILEDENPSVDPDTLLAWANMAKNSLQMWNGFSSYQLVLGCNPNLPTIATNKPPALQGTTSSEALMSHLNTLHSARKAFIQCETDEKIRRALRHQIRSVDVKFEPGELVYYKRENSNKWLGPGKVIFQDGRLVFVRHGGTYIRVSTNRIIKDDASKNSETDDSGASTHKSTSSSNVSSKITDDNDSIDILSEVIPENALPMQNNELNVPKKQITLKTDDTIHFRTSEDNNWKKATVMSRAGKSTGRNKNWFNLKVENGDEMSVNMDVIEWKKNEDIEAEVNLVMVPKEKHNDIECLKAKEVELKKLRDFDTYEEIENQGQLCISTRCVLWYKEDEVRARLVARGFEERMDVQCDSPTIGKSSIRVFLAVAASNGWKIKTTDIKSAFLQGKELDRDVFIIPPKEAKVKHGRIWHLKRCL